MNEWMHSLFFNIHLYTWFGPKSENKHFSFFRLPEGPILAKDLAIEYKYLSNTSEWFFNARKRANLLIEQGKHVKIGK